MDIATSEGLLITIVMPALNEEASIGAAIDDSLSALDYFNIVGEILIVNDGSSDETENVVRARMQTEPRVRLINHEKPQGIGASFWDGVVGSRGDIVTMFPGDNENDPFEALRYFKLLEHVDIIVPFVFNRGVRSPLRNVISLLYRLIIDSTFAVNFNYTNGTVFYRRSILVDLPHNSRGFFFQTEVLIKAVKRGYLFAEVPYYLNSRRSGKSKAVSFPSFLNVAKGYLQLVRDVYFSGPGQHNKLPLSASSVSSLRRVLPIRKKL